MSRILEAVIIKSQVHVYDLQEGKVGFTACSLRWLLLLLLLWIVSLQP